MEHSFHRFPFFCGTHSGSGLLENSHVFFPFLLTGKRTQALHCRIPVEIDGSFDNHEQAGSENINFHFKNAYFPDAGKDFRPYFRFAMPFAIFGNNSGELRKSRVWQYRLTGTV